MKKRADILLVEKGLFPSREKAKIAIMAGTVYQNTMIVNKASDLLNEDVTLEVKGNSLRYVSRGGLKLEKAINIWGLDFQNKVVLDVGSSTGGFTDCALQNGARHVFAVDVGTNQLAWKLRSDERVTVYEKTNFRHFDQKLLNGENINYVVIDVSFISLKIIFEKLAEIVSETTQIIALIKPQFEAGKDLVGPKGVIRDKKVHQNVVNQTINKLTDLGFNLQQLDYSPIKGGNGNIEFISLFTKEKSEQQKHFDISSIIDQAYLLKEG